MKLKMYAMFDSVAAVFTRPVFLNTEAEAVRGFTAECVNPESPVGKNPDDYTLYYIGEYDDENGAVTGKPVVRVTDGLSCVKRHTLRMEKMRSLQIQMEEIAKDQETES